MRQLFLEHGLVTRNLGSASVISHGITSLMRQRYEPAAENNCLEICWFMSLIVIMSYSSLWERLRFAPQTKSGFPVLSLDVCSLMLRPGDSRRCIYRPLLEMRNSGRLKAIHRSVDLTFSFFFQLDHRSTDHGITFPVSTNQ